MFGGEKQRCTHLRHSFEGPFDLIRRRRPIFGVQGVSKCCRAARRVQCPLPPSLPLHRSLLSSPLAHSLLCSKENCFADQTHGEREGRAGRPSDPRTRTGNESTHARTTAPRPSVGMPQISLAFSSCLLACSPAKSHFHLRTGRAARIRGHLLAKINRAACTLICRLCK